VTHPERDHPFELDDGAYLLGALSPDERAAYEAHLRTCQRCAESVAQLAGLPGLLGRVPPELAAALDGGALDGTAQDGPGPEAAELPPGRVLSGVLAAVTTEQRRRRRRIGVVLAAAAAVVVVAVGVAASVLGARTDEQPSSDGVRVVAFEQVAEGPMSVTAELTSVAWGTRIELVCRYRDGSPPSRYAGSASYALVLENIDGGTEQAASWQAVPGRTVTVQAATALPTARIASLEVRTASGQPVLRSAEPAGGD
jgi:hypothetical protein